MKKIYLFVYCCFLILSCSSSSAKEIIVEEEIENEVDLATLKTNEAEEIAVFKAVIWGEVTHHGGASVTERGVCYSTTPSPTYEGDKETPILLKASGIFKVNLSNLQGGTTYYARAYAVNSKGVNYGNQVSFTTLSPAFPLVHIHNVKVAAAHDLFIQVQLEEGDLEIKEQGVVYATKTRPSISDQQLIHESVSQSYLQRMTKLIPQTMYYIRPYVITVNDDVLYGEEVSMQTIKPGNFTYSFHPNDADEVTKNRIITAFDEAIAYYNNFTSIEKHVTVNYSPGTPTADANFDGWINMGANASYQRTGTAMHEMAHAVGVGTHWKYYDDLMQGTWKGERANQILKMLTGDISQVVKGDGTHFWPYGINGAHEDTGSDELYMIHALIIQGMKADGLPSN
ncbi:hypothetical protein [Wenyingzhuangia sp. IMCC45467]